MVTPMARWARLALAAVLTVPPLGCSTASITSHWVVAPPRPQLERILVIGVAKSEGVRRQFEDAFVGALMGRGVDAQASVEVLGPTTPITHDSVATLAQSQGFDAALVTHLLGTEKRTVYHSSAPEPMFGYYPGVYTYVRRPGYYEEYQYVLLETNVYSLSDESLLWSVRTKSFDDDDVGMLLEDLVQTLAARLAKDGMIPTGE